MDVNTRLDDASSKRTLINSSNLKDCTEELKTITDVDDLKATVYVIYFYLYIYFILFLLFYVCVYINF